MKLAGSSRLFRLTLELLVLWPLGLGGALAQDLHEAVIADDVVTIEHLLREGVDPDVASNNGLTALHYAAALGNETIAAMLLATGADVNAIDRLRVTPLFFAVQEGHEAVVGLLLDQGADVSARHVHGATPLHAAALEGHSEIARQLIRAGADPRLVNDSKETPLMIAVGAGQLDTAFAISDSVDYLDKHVTTQREDLAYGDLARSFGGGNVGHGRVWSTSEPTITPVTYPIGSDPSGAGGDVRLSGTWTMGNLLFTGVAELRADALSLAENSVMFFTPPGPISAAGTQTKTSSHVKSWSRAPSTTGKVDGYRVQIYAANIESSAMRQKQLAVKVFAEDKVPVYIEHERPLYKLRIGDFKTRREAQVMRATARRKGFIDAWVVKTPIRTRP